VTGAGYLILGVIFQKVWHTGKFLTMKTQFKIRLRAVVKDMAFDMALKWKPQRLLHALQENKR
jgi:hypothetical protein